MTYSLPRGEPTPAVHAPEHAAPTVPDKASLVAAAGARLRPLWYLGVGGCVLAVINTLYAGQLATALLFFGVLALVLDHLNGHAVHDEAAPRLTPGARWGQVAWYFTFAAVMTGSWFIAAPLVLGSVTLAGSAPLRVWWWVLRRQAVSIRGDRWVDFVAWVLIGVSLLFLVMGLAFGSLSVWFQAGPVEWRTSRMAVGLLGHLMLVAPPLILGIGIRRRALWAGVLGLCFTFWGLSMSLLEMLAATRGDVTRLPAAVLAHGIDVVLWWLFFFGFYSVFYPLLAEWAGQPREDRISVQLEDADAALASTKARLDDAESRASRTDRDLEEERLKLEAMFESINEGVALVDRDERISYLNPAMCEFYGIAREHWLGRT